MTTVKMPLCSDCKHRWTILPKGKEYGQYCDAYPLGIPEEILSLVVDHRKPYAGDGGIQYEKGVRDILEENA